MKCSKLSANPSFDPDSSLDWLRYNDFEIKLYAADNRLVYSESIRELQFIGSSLEEMRFDKPTILLLFPDGYYSSGIHNAEHGTFKVPSISSLTLARLIELNTNLEFTNAQLHLERTRVDAFLQQDQMCLLNLSNQRTARNNALQTGVIIAKQNREIQDLRLRIADKRNEINKKREKINQLIIQTRNNYSELQPAVASLSVTKLQMRTLNAKLIQRQKELVFDLANIYPIKDDCIRGINLPNSMFAKLDKELVAVALGHTSHCVSIISDYLYIPLRYPIQSRSSRSVIYDFISKTFDGSKQFPLYPKGSDKLRFEYAVFLLNKDIEQIMNAVGVTVKNLRQTLANIQLIYSRLEHICVAASEPNTTPTIVNWHLLNIPNFNSEVTGSEFTAQTIQ